MGDEYNSVFSSEPFTSMTIDKNVCMRACMYICVYLLRMHPHCHPLAIFALCVSRQCNSAPIEILALVSALSFLMYFSPSTVCCNALQSSFHHQCNALLHGMFRHKKIDTCCLRSSLKVNTFQSTFFATSRMLYGG
jgi:hypothetical protein